MTGIASFTVRGRSELAAATLANDRGVVASFLANGALLGLHVDDVMLNLLLGSPMGGSLGNVFLRSFDGDAVASTPLVGPGAPGRFVAAPDHVRWEGRWLGLDYTCTFELDPDETAWTWRIRVTNRSAAGRSVDLVLAQDVGLAHESHVRTNELYTSQYIDHTVVRDPTLGYVALSRQNLAQGGAHPWVAHGCSRAATGYLTDGFQLYGTTSRASGVPEALGRRRLPNRRLQYEVALPTLQSRRVRLRPGAVQETTFVGVYRADHPEASGPSDVAVVRAALARLPTQAPDGRDARAGAAQARTPTVFDRPALFASRELTPRELQRAFSRPWRHEEVRDGVRCSFFRGDAEHVVLRAKELRQDRPTGHLLRSGTALLPDDETLTVTAWMDGVFGSQLAIGNSVFNRLLTVRRDPLGVVRSSGRRIFVRDAGGWAMLGVPSAFAMTTHGARWIYDDGERVLDIRLEARVDEPTCVLDIRVERGGPVELLVADAVVAGQDEPGPPPTIEIDEGRGRATIRPNPATAMGARYPDAVFHVVTPDRDDVARITGDAALHADGAERRLGWISVQTRPVTRFRVAVTGSILDAAEARTRADRLAADQVRASAAGAPAGDVLRVTGGAGAGTAIDRLDEVVPWFVHDAGIHLSTPHGLEQYSGGAWGLRDVCQGPVEYLSAVGRHAAIAEVLRIVYANQERQTGDWPQWFMVDRFRDVRAPDSHGDIVIWPIKALCDYLEGTGDLAILDARVGYADADTGEPLTDHVQRQVDRIEARFVPGTALLRFGHGDWEDTLQPADPALAERLVSSWTVELAYETLGRYRVALERRGRTTDGAMVARLADLCARMRADFNRLLVPDGVVAGLVELGPDGARPLLHPLDTRTGVRYRLIPMTRGVISGMFTPAQARRHMALVRRHLSFPDGVRLMDRPMAYRGGTETLFRRAESAASFGREIGLQYVHAHLRFVQAMTRLGHADDAFDGLLAVCPVGIEQAVPLALPRQANAYFSSSDAAFADRAEASRRFGRLRRGEVGVRGGWRVYSSGPGIFLAQLVEHILGVRGAYDDILIDPVLPRRADGVCLDLEREGRRIRFRYEVASDGFGPGELRVNGRPLETRRATDPYRTGGLLVARTAFRAALDRATNVVDVVV